MDLYQAILDEERLLEKTAARLVNAAGDPDQRAELLAIMNTNFNALESAKSTVYYPPLRANFKRNDIAEQYRSRSRDIQKAIVRLQKIPPESGELFLAEAEVLLKEIINLIRWETEWIYPKLQKIVDGRFAEETGHLLKKEMDRIFYQERIEAQNR